MHSPHAFAALLCALAAAPASAHYLDAYAVSSHAACGNGDLPNTVLEIEKLLASPDFPDDLQKNVFWSDASVRVRDWQRGSSFFANTAATSGYDGADAGLVGYIASHGRTADGVFSALAGGGANGCEIKSSDMALGVKFARYLVLSTCQGLKIGTGFDPSAPGEDPRRTWAPANAGLNCLFGYSNNMIDADSYGTNLLRELATTDETLVEAFFHAAHDVHYSNLPAALCFGLDEANARQRLETSRRFVDERFGAGASAYVYERSQPQDGAFVLTRGKPVPRYWKLATAATSAARVARAVLGKGAQSLGVVGGLAVWRSERGTVTLDERRGRLAWRRDKIALSQEMTLKDDFVIRIAKDFARARGLAADPDNRLKATYILARGTSLAGKDAVVAKTVVLHPKLHGLTPFAAAAALEITVEPDGQVSAFTMSLVDASLPNIVEWIDTAGLDLDRHVAAAVASLRRELPASRLAPLSTHVGYARETLPDGSSRLAAAVEVVIEATQRGFARRYVRTLPL